jgi:hypothetical protein
VKLATVRSKYYEASGQVSENVRKLCFAGIGVIWVLRIGEKSGGITFDPVLLWPLSLFVEALALDLAHYLVSSAIWGIYGRRQEKRGIGEREFCAPRCINWPANAFFWTKALTCVAGYVLLVIHLAKKL